MRNEGDNKQTNSKHTNEVEEKVAEKVGCFYRLILLEKFIYILNLFAKKVIGIAFNLCITLSTI